jgi:sugar phosphate isomerase/epimerase
MNRIGLHIGYWYGSGAEDSLEGMLELTRRAGLDIIEFTPALLLKMAPAERKELRRRIESLGMKATINGGLDETNDLASDSPAVRGAGTAYCKRVLEAIPDVGAAVWSGIT